MTKKIIIESRQGYKHRTTVPKVIREKMDSHEGNLLRWEHYESRKEFLTRVKDLLNTNVKFTVVIFDLEDYIKKTDPERWKKAEEFHKKQMKELGLEVDYIV